MLKFLLQTAVGLTICAIAVTPASAQRATIKVTGAIEHEGAQRIRGTGTSASVTITTTTAEPGYNKVKLQFSVDETISTTPAEADLPGGVITAPIPKSVYDKDIRVTAILSKPAQAATQTAPATAAAAFDEEILLHVDSTPPTPLNPVVDRYPGGSATLTIRFKENDLDPKTVTKDDFSIYEEYKNDKNVVNYAVVVPEGAHKVLLDNTEVLLQFSNLNPGVYYVVVHGIADLVGNVVADAVGEFAPGETATKFRFVVPGGRERGEQVEYPRFLRPKNEQKEFDPGDRVDTKVVQLYYFRDARQIAEYINRNVQDLNQAGYDEAQRFAQQARAEADGKIDERRFQETLAVDAAKRTREVQHELDQARENVAEGNQQKAALTIQKAQLDNAIRLTTKGDPANLATAIATTNSDINGIPAKIDASEKEVTRLDAELRIAKKEEADGVPGAPAKREKLEGDIKAEKAKQASLEDQKGDLQNKIVAMKTLQANSIVNEAAMTQIGKEIESATAELAPGKLPKQLMDEQVKEIEDRNKVVRAEASELRAAQEQFRREVAAGMADRNSYAKGDMESIDPVTQVTVSVVGTSRIQLRGPIKGINKIGRMIHQLDTPVGQVKIGIHTIQVNGEHGDRMDFVYERINQEVAHSRFLVNTSSQLLRRAVQEVASEVALAADQGYLPDGCPPDLTVGIATLNGSVQTTPDQRDRRYLFAFFGSDFISELEEMDSELLNSENKLLSIHSMDTISLAGALFAMAHADNPVRQRIVLRFQELIGGELPQRETEYIQALTHVTSHGKSLQNRFREAMKIDSKNASEIYFNASRTYHFPNTVSYFNDQVPGQGTLNPIQYSTIKLAQSLKAQLTAEMEFRNLVLERSLLESKKDETEENLSAAEIAAQKEAANQENELKKAYRAISTAIQVFAAAGEALLANDADDGGRITFAKQVLKNLKAQSESSALLGAVLEEGIKHQFDRPKAFAVLCTLRIVAESGLTTTSASSEKNDPINKALVDPLMDALGGDDASPLRLAMLRLQNQIPVYLDATRNADLATQEFELAKEKMFSKRLLEQFMDDQEEKSVDLMEALRSHSSNVDNYLKRLAIALEDDVAAQFYEPAFQRIRRVSRTWDVTLGQIETTTVLTNNRTLAKVSPAASFEFDLPQRDILLTEALNGSKALAKEYGNLLKDPTFLAGTSMLSTQPATGILGSNAPIQGIPGQHQTEEFGSELQKLIPDPAIYKFETGTGFEIQPIIQPDGNSIVYGFDYMYSTNVREPVRADEKHLGRIKRHFVHTDVQTSSYELREISRYTVALKASRTDRGVPLLEDLPGVGAAFRPLPSDESSLQTNIILGSSTIYPTVFDLMGLRWSDYVDQLGTTTLAEQKDRQSSRREELREHLLNRTSATVNKQIGLPVSRQPAVHRVPSGLRILP